MMNEFLKFEKSKENCQIEIQQTADWLIERNQVELNQISTAESELSDSSHSI